MTIECPVCKQQDCKAVNNDGGLPIYECPTCRQRFFGVPKLYHKATKQKDGTILHEYRTAPNQSLDLTQKNQRKSA